MSGTALLVWLPRAGGARTEYVVGEPARFERPDGPITHRKALAAAHIVADPLAEQVPGRPPALDWEATLDYRRHLWSWGLGVAEAMDTAQRGMGLDWPTARELIGRSISEARADNRMLVCGAGTDQLIPGSARRLEDVERAYEEQCAHIEGEGGRVVLMASRELARLASGPDDYRRVYGRILGQLRHPAILHWLGDMFDPQLAGYWGHRDLDQAEEVCLSVIRENVGQVDGIKVSLLDGAREVAMRRRLPAGVRMYTGDDFNFAELIEGDAEGHSDALLGIFDAIAPAASAALQRLACGDGEGYRQILAPTVPLSRLVFAAPTYYYKTGVTFLAYLNGHQRHFRMVGGQEGMRSVVHLAELFVLAVEAGLLEDPEAACARMRLVLALAGME